MMKGRLIPLLGILFMLNYTQTAKAQSGVAVALNEYCASNTTGPTDNFGVLSDWVEIYNNHTASVDLSEWFLSNDRNNLFKWKFPGGFKMAPGEYRVIWLSGRNISTGLNIHANFTLDQCKEQWLILTPRNSPPQDSVLVQRTKAGHTRGRISYSDVGINYWRLFTTNSWLTTNPNVNYYKDYTPKPTAFPTAINPTATPLSYTSSLNTGLFHDDGAQIYYIKIHGITYDTLNWPCYDVYYTTDGNYPRPGTWTQYTDSGQGITMPLTGILRMVTVPSTTRTFGGCIAADYLPSFCETNTYFIKPEHQQFDERFGVISLAIDKNDTAWFNSQGSPPSTTVHVEYYDNKKQVTEGYAILNRPPNETWATLQRGYYTSIDDRYGFGCEFKGNIFNVQDLGTSTRTVFPTLHMKAGDIESLSAPNGGPSGKSDGTGLRDVFMQTLAVKNKLNVSPLHVKPVVAFVNGEYWGVYNLTEVFDKFYENFYYGQPLDQQDMLYYHNGEGSLSYPDGSVSNNNNNFKSAVYDIATTRPLTNISAGQPYSNIMSQLDKSSFIDYMILNSYAMNSDLWNFNIGFAKGGTTGKPGGKWHYYLWNMPAIFNFTSVATNTLIYGNTNVSPCYVQNVPGYAVSAKAHNGHGAILNSLWSASTGNSSFRLEYRNRYQDLLNGPLKCENILKHFELIDTIYQKEMRGHEDAGYAAGPGRFCTTMGNYDTNMTRLKKIISNRCFYYEKGFRTPGCFGLQGPYAISVDVTPAGAGQVRLNSMVLSSYPWYGAYYQTTMSFKAIPTSTAYAFHHWEFKRHTPKEALSQDSVSVASWTYADDVIAVFTDKSNELTTTGNANIPTGFTPNGDGINDYFRPLGSAEFMNDYQMTIWNRWGQEVFRSIDPTDQGWDGRYKGENAVTGVYAFIISYKNIYGEAKLVKGNVTLTR